MTTHYLTTNISQCWYRRACQSCANRVKDCFNKDTWKIIIESLVLSKLFYCSSVWANTSDSNIKKLQLIENFDARIITDAWKFDHITPHLQELTLLPVIDQLLYRHLILKFINASITWPLTTFVLNYLLVPAFTTAKHGSKMIYIFQFSRLVQDREPLNIEQQNYGTIKTAISKTLLVLIFLRNILNNRCF